MVLPFVEQRERYALPLKVSAMRLDRAMQSCPLLERHPHAQLCDMPRAAPFRREGLEVSAWRFLKIGWLVMLVISQAAPAVCIQPPTFDSRLAIQMPRKTRLPSGAKAEAGRRSAG